MRNNHANSRWSAPRLVGISAMALGTLVLLMMGFTGGVGAAPGDADLALTKSDSPDPVVVGNNVTYTIQVTNPNGPGGLPANNVVVTDNLPSGVDFVSATGGTCQRTGNTVTCDLGTVPANTTQTVTIVVKTKKEGTLTNSASVASPEDIVLGNNSATATTTVTQKAGKPGKKKGKVSCATPTITGTAGDDVLVGTAAGDVIVSYGGNDRIFSAGGKDLVCAGKGRDLVVGGPGGDTLIGGGGADTLKGKGGGDLLKGKNGRDSLRGNAGNDVLNGGKKRDNCKGGSGRDVLKSCP